MIFFIITARQGNTFYYVEIDHGDDQMRGNFMAGKINHLQYYVDSRYLNSFKVEYY